MQETLISGMVEETMKSEQRRRPRPVHSGKTEFSAIYERYATPVYRYAMARVGNRADAEDITSLVFMEALKSWSRFDKKGNVSALLFTIARNKIVDRYRREKRTIPLELISNTAIEDRDLLKGVMNAETATKLSQILSSLLPEQQELLRLRFAGELTYGQIGSIVGKSEAAVKMSVHRLLDRLQNLMEQDDE
jgi:RNA polymerase sigma-70 factor (ECF subfamily)